MSSQNADEIVWDLNHTKSCLTEIEGAVIGSSLLLYVRVRLCYLMHAAALGGQK